MIVVGQYVTVSNEVQTEPTQVETTPSALQTEATPNMTERAEEIQVETSPNVTLSTMSRRRPREQSEEVGFEPARLLRRTLRGIFRLWHCRRWWIYLRNELWLPSNAYKLLSLYLDWRETMHSNKRSVLARSYSVPLLRHPRTSVEHRSFLTSLSYEQTLENTIRLMHSVACAALVMTLVLILVLILGLISTHSVEH